MSVRKENSPAPGLPPHFGLRSGRLGSFPFFFESLGCACARCYSLLGAISVRLVEEWLEIRGERSRACICLDRSASSLALSDYVNFSGRGSLPCLGADAPSLFICLYCRRSFPAFAAVVQMQALIFFKGAVLK
jgi:hypothetical protein